MSDDERYGIDDFNAVPTEYDSFVELPTEAPSSNGHGPRDPLALSLEAFIADKTHTAPPLLGTEDEAILPAGGLVVVAGQAGVGKTTLVLDLVFHLVSGKTWLAGDETAGFPCARPLSVLLIENEGPREQFRRKLDAKQARWQSELVGSLWIQTWRWGAFSIADMEAAVQLGGFCEDNDVDLVVGDPLGTMGVPGVGSPEDTRDFIGRLHALGLSDKRAFLFLHHFRKDKATDEVDQISGAWGPHLDSLLVVKPSRKDQVRLSFPKLRWAAEQLKPIILNRVRATQAFEFDHEEGDARAWLPAILEYLERPHETGQTQRDIARGVDAQTKADYAAVEDVLKLQDHLFCSFTGEDAKERGRRANAVVWELKNVSADTSDASTNPLQIGGVAGARNPSPPIGGGGEAPAPIRQDTLSDDDLEWH